LTITSFVALEEIASVLDRDSVDTFDLVRSVDSVGTGVRETEFERERVLDFVSETITDGELVLDADLLLDRDREAVKEIDTD